MIPRRTSPANPFRFLFLLALVIVVWGAGPALATGYRYWSFWEQDGGRGDGRNGGSAWTYATQGPSTARPSDGDVQGLRFAVSRDADDAAEPRGAADFASICAKTPPSEGRKRVALVIDFGTAADAPSGETPPEPRTACALVPEDATTAEALAAVAGPLRYDTNALLCAIADYPEMGCGDPVPDSGADTGAGTGASASDEGSQASGAEDGSSGGPSLGLYAGAGVVVLLGAAAVWQARRRRG
ncbi:SCO2322 family protein [Streptomyces acidicola]|uniref:SCO2322 family protein n=1 Tax=Streptomyces acidicola TaxID=2596892 RepID=UPI002AD3BD90|nr:SCO2322 family protein [Streptomyces acidicola]